MNLLMINCSNTTGNIETSLEIGSSISNMSMHTYNMPLLKHSPHIPTVRKIKKRSFTLSRTLKLYARLRRKLVVMPTNTDIQLEII